VVPVHHKQPLIAEAAFESPSPFRDGALVRERRPVDKYVWIGAVR
jgi:hypothetical protein